MSREIQSLIDLARNQNNNGHAKIISLLSEVESLDFKGLFNHLYNNSQTYSWSKPNENTSFITNGVLFSIEENGPNRLLSSQSILDKASFTHINNFEDFKFVDIPLFFGGIKFSPESGKEPWENFADSDWFIPETLFIKKDEKYYICENFLFSGFSQEIFEIRAQNSADVTNKFSQFYDNEGVSFSNISDDDTAEWNLLVANALKEIENGEFSKIVLSRKVMLKSSSDINISAWLFALGLRYPRCYVFAYKKGNSIFFGATPEKLAVIHNRIIEADALAGSIPRGNSEQEDVKLADELLLNKKNCAEHRAVVDFIVESFDSFADEIEYPVKPVIKKLKNIQHLWTPIKGSFKSESDIFLMLKSIHPTPAICGTPWRKALEGIIKKESFNRGFFTGVIGWFNLEKEGEFAVGIRSALLKDRILYGYAGCGIVEGSDPEEEYHETMLKLKPILSLTEYEKVSQS
ncbi:MAG: isochorismate synthase MenF [Melioribacteraceae bacterium]|nr:MAG: isochorismate synthase MenF [Melioribacteraceae bacterium]